MDDELEGFKRKINLAELARSYGYILDERSQRTSYRMKNPNTGSKIIVATAEDGHGIFFDTLGSESGSVIDFIMWQRGCNLGYARKYLREHTGQQSFSFPTAQSYAVPAPIARDRIGVIQKHHLFLMWSVRRIDMREKNT